MIAALSRQATVIDYYRIRKHNISCCYWGRTPFLSIVSTVSETRRNLNLRKRTSDLSTPKNEHCRMLLCHNSPSIVSIEAPPRVIEHSVLPVKRGSSCGLCKKHFGEWIYEFSINGRSARTSEIASSFIPSSHSSSYRPLMLTPCRVERWSYGAWRRRSCRFITAADGWTEGWTVLWDPDGCSGWQRRCCSVFGRAAGGWSKTDRRRKSDSMGTMDEEPVDTTARTDSNSVSVSVRLSLCMSVSLWVSLCFSLSFYIPLFLSMYLCLCLSTSLRLFLSLFVSLYLYVCLYVSQCIYLSVCLSLRARTDLNYKAISSYYVYIIHYCSLYQTVSVRITVV